MHYINIPALDKPISVIGLGTNTIAFTSDTFSRAAELLDTFLDAGGNLIDTAHIYGFGASEKTLGRWLKQSGRRKDIVLVTKGCHPVVDPQNIFGKPWVPRVTPDAIRADLGESLERLHTDYVDLYLLHRDDEAMSVAPIIDALNQEQARGRVRVFGASNWRVERIAEANAYAASRSLNGFVVSSVGLSLARPVKMSFPGTLFADEPTRAWHHAEQFPLIAYSSLAAGFVSGKHDEDTQQVYGTDENFERLRRAKGLATRENASMVQMALAYILHQPFPTMALVGATTVAHLNETLAAINIELSEAELAFLDLKEEKLQ